MLPCVSGRVAIDLRLSSLKQPLLPWVSSVLMSVSRQLKLCKNGWAHLSVQGGVDWAATLAAAQKHDEEGSLFWKAQTDVVLEDDLPDGAVRR